MPYQLGDTPYIQILVRKAGVEPACRRGTTISALPVCQFQHLHNILFSFVPGYVGGQPLMVGPRGLEPRRTVYEAITLTR